MESYWFCLSLLKILFQHSLYTFHVQALSTLYIFEFHIKLIGRNFTCIVKLVFTRTRSSVSSMQNSLLLFVQSCSLGIRKLFFTEEKKRNWSSRVSSNTWQSGRYFDCSDYIITPFSLSMRGSRGEGGRGVLTPWKIQIS